MCEPRRGEAISTPLKQRGAEIATGWEERPSREARGSLRCARDDIIYRFPKEDDVRRSKMG